MKALNLLCAVLGMAAISTAQADVIGVKGNIDYWQYSADLDHPQYNPSNAQLADDYGLSFSVSVEHPIPFLPNAKIKHVNLKAESDESFSGTQRNQVDLDYSDFILYYEILDNIVNADIGAGVKSLEGDLRHNYTSTQDISETLPMVYAQAGLKLPFTGLSANAEVSIAGLNDQRVTDAQAELKYNFIDTLLVDIGAKAGYRILDIQLEKNSDAETKLKFKGPYIGVEAHF